MSINKNKCPRCGGGLTAIFTETREYSVTDFTTDRIEIDDDKGYCTKDELERVSCDQCEAEWANTIVLAVEAADEDRNTGRDITTKQVESCPTINVGDNFKCDECGQTHLVRGLKSSTVITPELLYVLCDGKPVIIGVRSKDLSGLLRDRKK